MNSFGDTVLLVDDDQRILDAYKRNLTKICNLFTAPNASEGIAILKKLEKVAVVISDYRMPGMNGVDFLAEIRKISPHTISIMLTGFGDLQTAMDAVNKGNVFRFLTKPCPTDKLVETLEEAIAVHHSLECNTSASTNSGPLIVSTLLTALAERDYVTEGHAARVTELCYIMGLEMGLTSGQLTDLEYFAQLHDVGKLGIPDHILYKKEPLSAAEWQIMYRHPEIGSRIALSSADLENAADFILKHHEHWDGNGYPLGLKGKEIPLECRILAVADAFDVMTHQRPYRKALPKEESFLELKRCAGTQFDPEIVAIFVKLFSKQ